MTYFLSFLALPSNQLRPAAASPNRLQAAQPKARRAADWPSRQAGRPTNGHYDYVHGART